MGDLTKVVVGAVVIAAIATIIAVVGQAIIDYWPIVVLLLAGLIALVVYRKRQARERNMV